MKSLVCLLAILMCFGLSSTVVAADAETRDFGLRIDAGPVVGLGAQTGWVVGVHTDFYCLSEQFRMTFGTTLVAPQGTATPWAAIHSLGIEYNFPIGADRVFVGTAYQHAYLQVGGNGLTGLRGWDYHGGYKHYLSEVADVFLLVGSMNAPIRQNPVDPGFRIADYLTYVSIGMEYYF